MHDFAMKLGTQNLNFTSQGGAAVIKMFLKRNLNR